jgi:hypothetical protein
MANSNPTSTYALLCDGSATNPFSTGTYSQLYVPPGADLATQTSNHVCAAQITGSVVDYLHLEPNPVSQGDGEFVTLNWDSAGGPCFGRFRYWVEPREEQGPERYIELIEIGQLQVPGLAASDVSSIDWNDTYVVIGMNTTRPVVDSVTRPGNSGEVALFPRPW